MPNVSLWMTDKKRDEDVLSIVSEAKRSGTLRYSGHALDRMEERAITVSEVEEIIKYGDREEGLDEYDVKGKYWRYVIRNKDVEERDLAISIDIEDAPDAIIVTVMLVDLEIARKL